MSGRRHRKAQLKALVLGKDNAHPTGLEQCRQVRQNTCEVTNCGDLVRMFPQARGPKDPTTSHAPDIARKEVQEGCREQVRHSLKMVAKSTEAGAFAERIYNHSVATARAGFTLYLGRKPRHNIWVQGPWSAT